MFYKDSDTIDLHLKNIYSTRELEEFLTTEDYSVVKKEGTRKVRRKIRHNNLDAIISVGYSINERALKRQNEQLSELQKTIKILSSAIKSKELTSDESKG